MKPLPPIEKIKTRFNYNPETGNFTRNYAEGRYGRYVPGTLAGTVANDGYIQMFLDGHFFMAHRAAWAIIHGKDPGKKRVYHLDGDHSNNKANNLAILGE